MQNNNNIKLLYSSNPNYGQSQFELRENLNFWQRKHLQEFFFFFQGYRRQYYQNGQKFSQTDSFKLLRCELCTALKINNWKKYCCNCKY